MIQAVISSESQAWSARRSAFRHDWLKNTLLNDLGAISAELDQSEVCVAWLSQKVSGCIAGWRQHRQEAWWLINHYEAALSPRSLLEEPPLCRLDQAVQEWLSPLIHTLWKGRYSIDARIQHARAALDMADSLYDALRKPVQEASSQDDFKALRPSFKAFHDACVRFGEALGVLPREVRLV